MVITIIFYLLGKWSIRNISEEKRYEIVAGFSITAKYVSKRKLLKFWHYPVLFFVFIFVVMFSFRISILFEALKIQLFSTSDGIFISNTEALFFVVNLVLAAGVFMLVAILLVRKTEIIPYEKWKIYPEHFIVERRVKRLRNQGFILSLFLQFLFLHIMLDYAIIKDGVIIHNPLGNLTEREVPMEYIQNAQLSYKYGTRKDRTTKERIEDLYPKFTFTYDNKNYDIWSIGLDNSDSIIEKTAVQLDKSNVNIFVNYPGVLEKAKWLEMYDAERVNKIVGVFDYVSKLSNALVSPVGLTKELTVDDFVIQIDSALFSNRENIYEGSDDKMLLIYPTLINYRKDTVYFSENMRFNIVDKKFEDYGANFSYNRRDKVVVPPDRMVQFMYSFDVPKISLDSIKLRYQPDISKDEFVYFSLE